MRNIFFPHYLSGEPESLPIIGPNDEDKITDEDNDQWTPQKRPSNSKSFNVWE